MKPYEHTRSRRGRIPARCLSPEQAASQLKRAISWRDEWRAEVAARQSKTNGHGPAATKPKESVAKTPKDGAGFATAVTRQEFGRFYWNGHLATQLANAMKGRPAIRRNRKLGRAMKSN